MDLQISGRTAIVTGASAGIGEAVARALAAEGARLVLVARGVERLDRTAAELRAAQGAEVLAVSADVADPATPQRVVDAALERFGSVAILVNNAGRAQSGGLMATSEADWHEMTETKFSALRRFCRAAVPAMRASGWGRIVNVSSVGGIYPSPHLMVSHALSAAIDNLTKSLALEVARDGILVNAVAVGAIATENWAANMLPDVRRRRPDLAELPDAEVMAALGREKTPLGRFGRAEEVADVAAFLASARNGFVTGHTTEVSGGADQFL